MKLFLILIGMFWVVIGTLSIFTTDLVRKKFVSKFKDMDFRKWSALPIIAGILFLIAAPITGARLFITILGVLSLVKGFYFILVPEKAKKMMDWWLNAKDSLYKIWGVAVLIFGVLVQIN